MSESHPNGAEKAAENATLKLWSRLMMAVGVPVGLAIGGAVAAEVWNTSKMTAAAVVRLEESVKGLTAVLNSRIDAHADRLKGLDERNTQQDARMDRTDQKIDAMQFRMLGRP